MLTSRNTQQLTLPHEPETTITVHKPSIGTIQRISQWVAENGGTESDFAKIGSAIMLAAECITAWSYDADVNLETVSDLDAETLVFLETHLMGSPDPNGSGGSTTP